MQRIYSVITFNQLSKPAVGFNDKVQFHSFLPKNIVSQGSVTKHRIKWALLHLRFPFH